jgi:hypothetical protein
VESGSCRRQRVSDGASSRRCGAAERYQWTMGGREYATRQEQASSTGGGSRVLNTHMQWNTSESALSLASASLPLPHEI